MLYWIPYAFVRITVFFIAGILTALNFPSMLPIREASAIFLVLVFIYFLVSVFGERFRRRFNPGFIGLIAIYLAGFVTLLLQTEIRYTDHYAHHGEIRYYRAMILTSARETPTSWKHEVQVTAINSGSAWVSSSGKALIYFSRDGYTKPFQYGDILLVKGPLREVSPPGNPGEFDYRKLLSYQNISHQQMVKTGEAMWIQSTNPGYFRKYTLMTREWARDLLLRVVEGRDEQAIACALVLGVTDHLEDDLMNSYAATGAMHVLAVSGLHIGILYLLLGWVLRPLKRLRHGKWYFAGVSLFILWSYAAITGLSPSVLRAVTMFSFVALAQPMQQRTNIYNTLAASAFCILVFDPFLVMSVGFQLSYLAVLGIVYLHPLLYNWLEPDSRLLDEIWKITSMSFAAQIATFPLSLYYFHQFPNYFWLSNLFVIPLGFGILVNGIAILLTAFIPPVASMLGFLLTWMIKLMNYLIVLAGSLPHAVTDHISISLQQCFILFALIILSTLFFQYKKLAYLYAVALLMILFSVNAWQRHVIFDNYYLTVYKVSGMRAVDFIHQGKAYTLADSALASNAGKTGYHLSPHRVNSFSEHILPADAQPFSQKIPGGLLATWHGKTILRLETVPESIPNIKVDYLILSKNTARNLTRILNHIQAGQIILDSSNSFAVANAATAEYLNHPVALHSVWHHGAFHVRL